MSTVKSITRAIAVEIIRTDDPPARMPVLMRYETFDPYAVSLIFLDPDGRDVLWVFARELLALGLEGAVGEGDVLVRPVCRAGTDLIRIALSSPQGAAVLEVSAFAVRRFLTDSYSLCRLGEEGRHVDLDSALLALLAS
jgi:hypothetical protein